MNKTEIGLSQFSQTLGSHSFKKKMIKGKNKINHIKSSKVERDFTMQTK